MPAERLKPLPLLMTRVTGTADTADFEDDTPATALPGGGLGSYFLIVRVGVAVGGASWLDGMARFRCRAAQEVSVPDGSSPVGVVVIVI